MTGFEKPSLEIADIFNKFSSLLAPQPRDAWKVIQAIKNCRTSVLGGHQLKCESCGLEKPAYNSCRNRHCPKCQFLAQTRWIEAREEDLISCQYFHVVFTVPGELKPVFLLNKRACYDLLFAAASETIREVCANEKNLGAEYGAIGVLHTWSQNLLDHPHVHFIVPGGGLSKDKNHWISSKKDFFAPIRVLSAVFRGKLLEGLREAYTQGRLQFKGEGEYLNAPQCFDHLLLDCALKKFVVYAKPPFAGPKQVIAYLGRYTHRIAISNYRLVKLEGETISFKIRDPDNPGNKKIMSLHVKEFMRRFLLHALPKGYVRIRHYGFLSPRSKKLKIQIIRALLGFTGQIAQLAKSETWKELLERKTGIRVDLCPHCQSGRLATIRMLPVLLNSS